MGNASEGQLEDSLRRHDARWKFLNSGVWPELHAKGAGPGLGVETYSALFDHRRWPNQSAQRRSTPIRD